MQIHQFFSYCRFSRSFLLVMLAFILTVPLMGQKQEVDVVYLNNGEVYRGALREHFNQDMVQIETLCYNLRLFRKEEVSRIEREKVDLIAFRRDAGVSEQGYFNRTDLGILIGSGNNNNAIFSIQMVNGYKFGKRYFPGIGVGLEFYEQAVLPLYADFSYQLGKGSVVPVLRASLGYSLAIEDPREQWGTIINNHGGLMYAAGVGTWIRTGSSSALSISLVYRYQSLISEYEEEWSGQRSTIEKRFNRIALRVGFVFD